LEKAMKKNLTLITSLHTKTKRDYLPRVVKGDKAECAAIAKQFGKDYWDGDRKYGYGGYKYDERWAVVAQKLITTYHLNKNSSILDVGCGKGFLLYELKKIIPEIKIAGIDISTYALENSKEEVKSHLKQGAATKLDFPDKTFDLVISVTTLHNLYLFDLAQALKEIQRVTRGDAYVVVESYRNEAEKSNLLNWQLTCESFFTPEEWVWLFNEYGYKGDYEFVFFE
jgi:SAM-dependent methyltransferase